MNRSEARVDRHRGVAATLLLMPPCFLRLFIPFALSLSKGLALGNRVVRQAHHKRNKKLIVTGLIIFMPAAHADDVGNLFFDELRRQEQRETQRLDSPPPEVRLSEPVNPADEALPKESPCFTITAIKIEGLPKGGFSWAQKVVNRFVNQCIGVQGINIVVKRLQAEWLARGYITTKVYVPKQDLLSATLTLQVVPGMISDIRFDDSPGRGSWRMAFPSEPGELLNLRDLETGLEQMKRLPSQDVDFKLLPGSTPGATDIVIHRQAVKPWRITAGVDNSGSEAASKWQGSLTAAYDDPFGLNDLFNVAINTGTDGVSAYNNRGNSAHYSLPWGRWTLALFASGYHYKQTVQGINEQFVTSGDASQYELRTQYLLHRSARSKTSLTFNVMRKSSHSYLEDVEIISQRRALTIIQPGISQRRYVRSATLDVSLSMKAGVSWLGAQADPQQQDPAAPTSRFRLYLLDASLNQPLHSGAWPLRYQTTLRVQHSSDRLFSTEFFAIGNRYTVRGFDGEQTLSAERGLLWRNELALGWPRLRQEWYVGLDYGRIGGVSAPAQARALAGSALGVRGQWRGLQYELSAGWPLHRPDSLTTRRPAYVVQVSYTY